MSAELLYSKFQKGVMYFKEKWSRGLDTPPVRNQLEQFNREVIDPMDRLFAGMTAAERRRVEDEYVPF